MYAQLTWDAKQKCILSKSVALEFDPLQLTEADRKARLVRAVALVKKKIVGETEKEKESLSKQAGVIADMSNIVLRVPGDELDFAMHMCLAHHLLPPEKRKTRTDTFQKVVDAQHTGAAAPGPGARPVRDQQQPERLRLRRLRPSLAPQATPRQPSEPRAAPVSSDGQGVLDRHLHHLLCAPRALGY